MKHFKISIKLRKQLALKQWRSLTIDNPKVETVNTRVPSLDLKAMKNGKRSIFNLDDVDFDEFATFISQKNENAIELIKAKELSKIKILGLKQLLSVIDKKVMIRRFDFWLPLRNYDKEKKQEMIKRKMNKSWCENTTPQKKYKYTETHLNDKMFDDPKICEELLKESQNIYIRKVGKDAKKGCSPISDFPADLSIV